MWLLGSFAVLSLLYRAQLPDVDHDQAVTEPSLSVGEGGKRARVRQAYAALLAAGEPVTGTRLAQAAGVSASYGRALLAEFTANSTAAEPNGQRPDPARAEP